MADGERAPTFGLVAGEASGDNLGGPLIRALASRAPGSRFVGIAGPRMSEAGCDAWYPSDTLAVMGLAEILRHLPRLLRLRRDLLERLVQAAPDAFVGIDSPEFNLRIARALKERGVPTVQYVSPQVWAWRQGRVRSIGQSVDLILCVLPFETAFYEAHAVRAVFVGHPLADRVPLVSDPAPARAALGLPAGGPVVAVLPGSRRGEVARLGPPFAATVAWLAAQRPELSFVSGTATLETALVKRPMVVAYRVAPLTSWLLRGMGLVKTEFFSQPNLLAGRALVPEFFQEQVRPDVLGPAVLAQLERPDRASLIEAFTGIHQVLRRDASQRAAEAVLDLVAARRTAR